MSDQIVSDIRAIAVDLATVDRMSVELAAQEIERLRGALEVQKDISGMLRAQLRMFGHIPCVVENEEVGKAEYKMRAAARGN